MTKQAVLPTGEVIHFPDDAPDEHVHATVRSKMGLPPPEPPVDPSIMASQQTAAAMQGAQEAAVRLTQSTAALHQQMGNVMMAIQQAVQGITHANAMAVQAVASLSRVGEQVARAGEANAAAAEAANRRTEDAITRLGAKIDEAAANMVKAVTAPKTVIKKDGHIVGVSTDVS